MGTVFAVLLTIGVLGAVGYAFFKLTHSTIVDDRDFTVVPLSGPEPDDEDEEEEVDLEDDSGETIILVDEKTGEEVEYFILDFVELDKREYIGLLAVEDLDNPEGEVLLMRVEYPEDGQGPAFVSIDDSEEFMAVVRVFEAAEVVSAA